MNVRLLRKVKDHILAEPRRLDMSVLMSFPSGESAPPCGTVGCIAGWANYLEGGSRGGILTATKLLELGRGYARRDRLFFIVFWPGNFSTRYINAKDAKTRAEVTAERIEHFIKTKGKE